MSQWTKTPPSEPGWYWRKTWHGYEVSPEVVEVTRHPHRPGHPLQVWRSGCDVPFDVVRNAGAEWWPEPIEPPE